MMTACRDCLGTRDIKRLLELQSATSALHRAAYADADNTDSPSDTLE